MKKIHKSLPLFILILILSACSGGSSGGDTPSGPEGVAGASGSVCVTGDTTYRIEVDGEQARNLEIAVDPLAATYQGNIGGQIRAVRSVNISLPDQPVRDVLVWGSGASVKFGLPGEILGTTPLRRPGAVTSLAAYRSTQAAKLVYGSERGIGIMHSTGTAIEEEYSNYRAVPGGVLSVAVAGSGERIVFASGDGLVQMISETNLSSRESCFEIIATHSVLRSGNNTYMPAKVMMGDRFAFVLARLAGSVPSSMAPSFDEVYDPIFTSIIRGTSHQIVRAVDLGDHKLYEAVPEVLDGSYRHYDSFIPTDLAVDGQVLYVIGVVFNRGTVQEFLAANCSASDEAGQVTCLKDKSRDGSFIGFRSDGKYAVSAGYFIYRNMDDLSKAAHFESIPLAAFRTATSAPPFLYRIAVDGGSGFVRGPNFLVSMTSSVNASSAEDWDFTRQVDVGGGLTAGIPNDIIPFSGGAASSFTAVRNSDGSGASLLEAFASDGTFAQVDSGTVFARVEGGGGSRVAAIETTGQGGGNLFVENVVVRTAISSLASSGAFVSRAFYDGSVLALAWSTLGTATAPESTQAWHLSVQSGTDSGTRGNLVVQRSGDPRHFAGFPTVAMNEPSPGIKRGVADVAMGAGQKLFVLYSGYAGGRWYEQLGVYNVNRGSSGPYEITLAGVMNTATIPGSANAHGGKILKIDRSESLYTVKFSAADGIYSWSVTPGTTSEPAAGGATRIFGSGELVDATADAYGGNSVALLSGGSIRIKDLSSISAPGTQFGVPLDPAYPEPNLFGARMALAGNTLAIALPYGAQAPFLLYNLSQAALTSYCMECTFLDVNIFGSFRNYLLASSISSGIEIYAIGE